MTLAAPGDGSRPPQLGDSRPGPVTIERPGEPPGELLRRIGLASRRMPVIVVRGGADDMGGPALSAARAALGPGIREAVAATGAAIIDGGADSGVVSLLGAERERDPLGMPLLIGIAPEGKVQHSAATGDRVALEQNHTHFVLANNDLWGGETALLAALAAELAQSEPVAMVLAGGAAGTLAEVEQAVARHWPLLVIEGTGGLADEIAVAFGGDKPDRGLRSILATANVRRVGSAGELAGELVALLRDDTVPHDRMILDDAWQLFATYDLLAARLRRTYERFQSAALVLGVVATALALTYNALHSPPEALRWLVIVAPICMSVLMVLANRRGARNRWVLMRAAAEAARSEIYRYRTRTGVYSRDALRDGPELVARPQRLADRLSQIESALIQTTASWSPIPPYKGPVPFQMYGAAGASDGFTRLSAEAYADERIGDQLAWYRVKVLKLDRLRARLQVLTLAAGGSGTLLAAAGLEVWIGLTSAVSVAALAHLGYRQIDNTLVAYNRAASLLSTLLREFRARSADGLDVEVLVTRTETIITTELGGWVQQMTDTLAKLQAERAQAATRSIRLERLVGEVGDRLAHVDDRMVRVTHTLEGQPLVNYQGFVSVRVLDGESGEPLAIANDEATLVPGRPHLLDVEIAPQRRGDAVSEEVAIFDGQDSPEVPFEVGVDADSLALRTEDEALPVAFDGRNATRFPVTIRSDQSYETLWVRVGQRGRIVQIVELRLRTAKP